MVNNKYISGSVSLNIFPDIINTYSYFIACYYRLQCSEATFSLWPWALCLPEYKPMCRVLVLLLSSNPNHHTTRLLTVTMKMTQTAQKTLRVGRRYWISGYVRKTHCVVIIRWHWIVVYYCWSGALCRRFTFCSTFQYLKKTWNSMSSNINEDAIWRKVTKPYQTYM